MAKSVSSSCCTSGRDFQLLLAKRRDFQLWTSTTGKMTSTTGTHTAPRARPNRTRWAYSARAHQGGYRCAEARERHRSRNYSEVHRRSPFGLSAVVHLDSDAVSAPAVPGAVPTVRAVGTGKRTTDRTARVALGRCFELAPAVGRLEVVDASAEHRCAGARRIDLPASHGIGQQRGRVRQPRRRVLVRFAAAGSATSVTDSRQAPGSTGKQRRTEQPKRQHSPPAI